MMKSILKVIFLNVVLSILLLSVLEVTVRLFFSYNNTFPERKTINAGYVQTLYGKAFSPSQTIYEVKKGRVLYDSVKYHINRYSQRGEDYPV